MTRQARAARRLARPQRKPRPPKPPIALDLMSPPARIIAIDPLLKRAIARCANCGKVERLSITAINRPCTACGWHPRTLKVRSP